MKPDPPFFMVAPLYEEVHAPDSPEGSEGLLAVVVRYGHAAPPGVQFMTTPDQPLQMALMGYPAGHVVPAHVHLPNPRVVTGTQELVLVRRGRVTVRVFTSAGVPVRSLELGPGDFCLLLAGGHELTAESRADVMEVKTGPYAGSRELDKREFRPCPCGCGGWQDGGCFNDGGSAGD